MSLIIKIGFLKKYGLPPQYAQHTKGLSGYNRSKNRFSQTQGNYQQESVVGNKKEVKFNEVESKS